MTVDEASLEQLATKSSPEQWAAKVSTSQF
jgi:hypothetical protein